MRVLMTGGGTAGHINPALAIAETIRRNDPSAVIEFVGVRGGKEEDLVPREGYPLHYVESAAIHRSLSPANLRALYLAVTSPYAKQTREILDQFQPDIVIGTGGYASWPILVAAAKRKIPTAVHESNASPGLTVKALRLHVDEIWVNFPTSQKALGKICPVFPVGNPTRQAFGTLSRESARRKYALPENRRLLLSFGGSLGAEHVNDAVLRLMRDYSSQHPEILHVHAVGKRNYEESQKCFRAYGLDDADNCVLLDYIYDMPERMAAADLVISRAGAMTVSELSLMGKAAILVPSPYVADNHQFKNAKLLADAGAAALLEESDLSGNRLTETVKELFENNAARATMEKNIRAFADPDANKKIWERILTLVRK